MKPLSLLVGEGKNAKYVKGTACLKIFQAPSGRCLFSLSLSLFSQPAQSSSWEKEVRFIVCQWKRQQAVNFTAITCCLTRNSQIT